MEWTTVQHLDLRHVARSAKPLQPHAAAFHPTQSLIAAAVGTYLIEFDALTGSKISCIEIGSPVVRMAYSPTSGHAIIAILEDCTIRSCDFDTEQTCVLHSPEKKTEHISSDTEVHLALTPLQPVVFFGFHKRMSVTVVGTVEGGRVPTKIKTDLKKPVVNLACHPRLPILYVAYADGLVRAYNIQSYAVHYTLQLDNTIKLIGAGAFAFHPTLEWIFIGDRRGTLLAWDVSTERPTMIGITQVGSQPITSVSWLPMIRSLVTLSKDGTLQVWKTRVVINPNRPPVQANFFEPAAIESIDIPNILSQQGGEAVYPLPRIKAIEAHPRLNLAALVFTNVSGGENLKNRATFTREGRRQLFAVLQSARGSSASVLKEKLAALGSSGILAEHQLQAQLQEHHLKGQGQITIADIARKAFLYSHFMEGHSKNAPILRLPLISVLDAKHHLKDIPVCQPFHLELNFFNKENRVLHYPVRAFYIDGLNLVAYNLCSGAESIYKKLYTSIPANVEYYPKCIVYSKKRHIFLVVYEFSGSANEVVLYWENTHQQSANSKANTIKGRDAAFIGPNENQFVILDEDKTGLAMYILPGLALEDTEKKLDEVVEQSQSTDAAPNSIKGPIQFMFEDEVDRIFSTPLDSTLMFACHGKQICLAKLVQGSRISISDGHSISTKTDGKRAIKLKMNETVLQMMLPIAVEDVKREVKILQALTGHENVVQFYNAFEDENYVYIAMELCEGGELLDRILAQKDSRYTEKDAAIIVSQMLKVAARCHLHGLVHRDMKPENFLFKSTKEDSPLKATGFGLSDFIRPGKKFHDIVGSAYYVAPEVLKRKSGPESDVWSIGVITYILLCGRSPFWDKTEDGIFKEVLRNKPDFHCKPWLNISNSAKDFVTKLLMKDPRARLTAAQALSHSWVREGGSASEIPVDISVLNNMRQFVMYSRVKQIALRAFASTLNEEEISDLRDQFDAIDVDRNGSISLEEMRQALAKDLPWKLKESRVLEIFQAIDSNTDGLVDFPEFVAATLHVHQLEEHNSELWHQRSQAAFEKFDVDRDGFITPEELKLHTGLKVSIEPLLEEADIDRDGKISLQEFRTLLRTASMTPRGYQTLLSLLRQWLICGKPKCH